MSSSPGRDVVVAGRRVLDVLALRYWGSEVPVTELTPHIVLFSLGQLVQDVFAVGLELPCSEAGMAVDH